MAIIDSKLTLIHLSDTHGKLAPHWEKFADERWHADSGGFAKTFTKIRQIRAAAAGASLLCVNGDNFHGGAELLFTRGRAVVPILNAFGIDAYTPGNWDFADGSAEFRARFVGSDEQPRLVDFPVLAAGVYNAAGAPPGAAIGARLLPPYLIKRIGDMRIAVIGMNDDKPAEQAAVFAAGLDIRAGWDELPTLIAEVRAHGADLVVAMSEAGLAQNLAIVRDYPGIDIMLSGDTHEETRTPIRVGDTIVVESGEGSRVGQLDLRLSRDERRVYIKEYTWCLHEVDEAVPADAEIKSLVDRARAPFIGGTAFTPAVRTYPGWAPGTGMVLARPLDTVIGTTDTDLERQQVLEGIGDDVIADALRTLTGADLAATNGFRFDMPLPAGAPITIGDVFNWLPLGAHVAVAEITGGHWRERMERYLQSVFAPNPYLRGGGWVPRIAGARFELDFSGPHGPSGKRIVKAEVFNRASAAWEPVRDDGVYTFASCHTPGDALDHMCRTSGLRNMKFLLSDGSLAPPLVPHQNPNPQPKLKVAPDNVMSAPEALLKFIEQCGVRAANHTGGRWKIIKGSLPASPLMPHAVQPLPGSGPDWMAALRVGEAADR